MTRVITTAERERILASIDRYAQRNPNEAAVAARIRRLVVERDDCLLRSCPPGHLTASAWIVAPDRRRFLLTHHAKLDRWLQLGGHVDGEADLHLAALREAREESGMERFAFVPGPPDPLNSPEPFDLDVHVIPARGEEPKHEHHDVRFLLVAEPGQELKISAESKDLRWFDDAELERVAGDTSVIRLGQKARALLARPPRAET